MYEFLTKWIISSDIGTMNMSKYLGDDTAINRVSLGFSKRSSGFFKGASGVFDGWLVRMFRSR